MSDPLVDTSSCEDMEADLGEIAEPHAAAMIQSLRAFGYDLPTATADLIDNSISAGAKNIWLTFHWSGAQSYVAIADDGRGMSEASLINAMRPGSRNPQERRDLTDLGRFGLGLKTASFSQCERLTVGTKTAETSQAVRAWDLEYVTTRGEWRLQRGGSAAFQHAWERLQGLDAGTVVLWEKMDRMTAGTLVDSEEDHKRFLERVEEVREHLAMVFHRFLAGRSALRLWINDARVKPWDPFLTDVAATQLLTDLALPLLGTQMQIKPYVLPHHSKLTAEAYAAAAGPRGWTAQQGFYVYRNKRLLAAGDWLGLGLRKEDHFKLARIQLDIPNSMDAEWEIDVKKSRASPPAAVRHKLRQLAELTRREASGIYRHRGTRLVKGSPELKRLWTQKVLHGRISYEVSRDFPLVEDLLAMGGEVRRKVQALLDLIEETVPVPQILIDGSENPNKHARPFEQKPSSRLPEVLKEMYQSLLLAGFTRTAAKLRLAALEPFNQYPELLAALDEE